MDAYRYGLSERLEVSDSATVETTPVTRARTVSIIATANVFYSHTDYASATTGPWLPYNAERIVALNPGEVLSFLAETGTPAGNYVYVCEVTRAPGV